MADHAATAATARIRAALAALAAFAAFAARSTFAARSRYSSNVPGQLFVIRPVSVTYQLAQLAHTLSWRRCCSSRWKVSCASRELSARTD